MENSMDKDDKIDILLYACNVCICALFNHLVIYLFER